MDARRADSTNGPTKENNKMRSLIFAAAASATCLFLAPAYSQGNSTAGRATAGSPYKKELERGYRLKSQNRVPEAIAAFSAVAAKDPANHAALTELGYLNAGIKHYASAAKYLRAASEQEPDNMRLRMDLGYVLQSAKRPSDAAEQFRFVAERPGEFQDQAQKALTASSAAAPVEDAKDAAQRRLRAAGYAALKRGDAAAASKSFTAAVANDPSDSASLKQLGFIELGAGRAARAAEHFEAARALEPNDLFVALQLGYTYDRLHKQDQAREQFLAASASTDEKIRAAAQAALQSSSAAAPVSSL